MNNILTRMQDIQLDDLTLKTQYYTLFSNGQIDEAKALVTNNSQLNGKVLTQEMLNTLITKILYLEQLYYTNVEDVLSDHLSNFQLSIDELIYMSEYNNTISYEINNFVMYNSELYYCYATPSVGTLPTDTDYWIYLGLKGDVGYYPLGVNYVGSWSSLITYSVNQMVVYNNLLYISLTSNSNIIPTNSTTDWLPMINIEYQNIFVSSTAPNNIATGQIWVELL